SGGMAQLNGIDPLIRSSTASGRNAPDSLRDSGQISFELLGTYGSVRRPGPAPAWAPAPVGRSTWPLPIEIRRSLGCGSPTLPAGSRSCALGNPLPSGGSGSFPEPRRKVLWAESDHVASAPPAAPHPRTTAVPKPGAG